MRILIAEDDKVSATVLSKIVSAFGEVHVTANGEEAFVEFQEALDRGERYDVAFLDIMMPEVDGQETLQAMREYERQKGIDEAAGIKVIMVTALTDGDNIYMAHRSSCSDYISKPISRDNIIKAMQRLNLTAGNA